MNSPSSAPRSLEAARSDVSGLPARNPQKTTDYRAARRPSAVRASAGVAGLEPCFRIPMLTSIAGCEAILADPNVVLHARTHRIRAALQGPFHDLRLMAIDTGRGPGRAGNDAPGFRKQNIEQMFVWGQRVVDSHSELHVRSRRHKAGIDQPLRTVNVRQVEYLDLRRNLELLHSSCKIEHQRGRILVHDRREVRGSGRERGHIRPMDER